MNRARRIVLAAPALAAVLLVRAPAQAATSTSTLTVTANIATNCTLTGGTIAFGTYDPLVANATANLDASSTGFTVACTKGTSYAVSLGLGLNASGTVRRMKEAVSVNFLNYEIYLDAGRLTVWNSTNTVSGVSAGKAAAALNAFGRVPSGQDAAVGSYSDTVVATVTF